jgi:hypothetical protein
MKKPGDLPGLGGVSELLPIYPRFRSQFRNKMIHTTGQVVSVVAVGELGSL